MEGGRGERRLADARAAPDQQRAWVAIEQETDEPGQLVAAADQLGPRWQGLRQEGRARFQRLAHGCHVGADGSGIAEQAAIDIGQQLLDELVLLLEAFVEADQKIAAEGGQLDPLVAAEAAVLEQLVGGGTGVEPQFDQPPLAETETVDKTLGLKLRDLDRAGIAALCPGCQLVREAGAKGAHTGAAGAIQAVEDGVHQLAQRQRDAGEDGRAELGMAQQHADADYGELRERLACGHADFQVLPALA